MPDEIIPPTEVAVVAPVVSSASTLRCQFCDCSLTASGEVLRMSKRAKDLRDFEDDLEDAKRQLHDLGEVNRQVQAELDELKRQLAAKKRSSSDDD
jgi:hypothetical protein